MFHLNWPGFGFLRCVWGPEVGGTAHLQSQGEGEAANPHRPVPHGFEPWTLGSEVQHPTPELLRSLVAGLLEIVCMNLARTHIHLVSEWSSVVCSVVWHWSYSSVVVTKALRAASPQ